ncbi:Spy/CpxP family protein refolding chaperone [Pseudoduganella sp. OTU4001]|uniref:Spy/CpxP family protein refolding chaperone n=1 Tax=Pseudoduganella sp. OTU4001 TaxID=3043854 RepID=UPI00313CEAE3
MEHLFKLRRRWIAAVFAAIATTAVASGAGHAPEQHISMMVSHVLENGTPEQKARLTDIALSCFKDLQPLQKQMGEGHTKVSKMLLEPKIDRASLDVVRSQNMQVMDQMSRRVLQAAMDAADILTVEQRAMFNKGLHKMAMSHMHGH